MLNLILYYQNHFQKYSNTFFFDKCLGWEGLCIEADEQYHEKLISEAQKDQIFSYSRGARVVRKDKLGMLPAFQGEYL